MISAARLLTMQITTIAAKTLAPALPNRIAPACATKVSSDVTLASGTRYKNTPLTTIYTPVTMSTPKIIARGRLRPGSRASPAILLTSHHPPKVKNAPTIAIASAGPNGSDPDLCATSGAKFDHDPIRNTSAHTTRNPRIPSLSHVLQRRTFADTRTLRKFKMHSAQITAMAAALASTADRGTMYAT